jgi:transcriptional regulator with XRE-family HTH domain
MNENLKVLLAELHARMPDVQVIVDPGLNEDATTWLDLRSGDRSATIEHRPLAGFGLYTIDNTESEDDFGTGPTEIYRAVEPLLVRLVKHFGLGASDLIGLRELRELCLLTQEELGERAGKKQSAISKVESRDELRLGTLVEYVQTLGGNVQIRANFLDFDVPLSIPSSDERKARRFGSVRWVNRPTEVSGDRLSAAARSSPKNKRARVSPQIEIMWTEGVSQFTLTQCDQTFVLLSTSKTPAIASFQRLKWFDKIYKLTPSATDPMSWNVTLPLRDAQLHVARMRADVSKRGEEFVLPCVS